MGMVSLPARDRSPGQLRWRHLLVWLTFNGLALRRFWKPLLEHAKRYPPIVRFMRAPFYCGIVTYNFFPGCKGRT